MSKEQMMALWRQRPFQPFEITTVTGDKFEVSHPNLLIVSDHDVTIGIPDPVEPPPAAKELIWLDLENITEAQVVGTAS